MAGRALLNPNYAYLGERFRNWMLHAQGMQCNTAGYAFPAILDDDGYPVGTPTENIYIQFNVPGEIAANDRIVMKWTGTGGAGLSHSLSFAQASTIDSSVGLHASANSTNIRCTGADGRIEFHFAGTVPSSMTFTFLTTGNYRNFPIYVCKLSDETILDNLTDPYQVFSDAYVAFVRGINPKIWRTLNWTLVNEANNITAHDQRWAWDTALCYANTRWKASKWGGDVTDSGTDAYVGSAATDTPGSYTHGEVYQCRVTEANTTTTPTLNVGGRGAKTIKNMYGGGVALAIGDIGLNRLCTFIFDSLLDCWLVRVGNSAGGVGGLTANVPIELHPAFANIIGADIWVNLPPHILDSSVGDITTVVKNGLNKGLNAYFEYANEIWNFGAAFHQTYWAVECGLALDIPSGNQRPEFGWYALRHRQIMPYITTAWGDRDGLKRVLAIRKAGALVATEDYRLNGGDLVTTNAGYNTWVGVNYNSAPNRPVDVSDVLSYATYYSGAIVCNDSANWTATDLSQATDAADDYASGNATRMQEALDWIDNDFRQGTRGGSLGTSTLKGYTDTIQPQWNDLAAEYGLVVVPYEGALEGIALTTSRCTTLGIDTSYGNTSVNNIVTVRGTIQNLIEAWKADDRFELFTADCFASLMAEGESVAPAMYLDTGDPAPACNRWAILNGDRISSPGYKSYDALVEFNGDTRRWSLKLT